MLVFDNFPSIQNANDFASYVRETFSRSADVYVDANAARAVDPFPFELFAPVVMVQRDSLDGGPEHERAIERAVKRFGGTFAGT